MTFRTKPTWADLIPALCVLALALLLFFHPWQADEAGLTLVVTTPEGSTAYALTADREVEIESRGIRLTVVISGGEARVSHSDCPDGVCLASGKISRSGEVIVCAPAGVSLTVKGGKDGVDFVAG